MNVLYVLTDKVLPGSVTSNGGVQLVLNLGWHRLAWIAWWLTNNLVPPLICLRLCAWAGRLNIEACYIDLCGHVCYSTQAHLPELWVCPDGSCHRLLACKWYRRECPLCWEELVFHSLGRPLCQDQSQKQGRLWMVLGAWWKKLHINQSSEKT